jgi:hypothetical protein
MLRAYNSDGASEANGSGPRTRGRRSRRSRQSSLSTACAALGGHDAGVGGPGAIAGLLAHPRGHQIGGVAEFGPSATSKAGGSSLIV